MEPNFLTHFKFHNYFSFRLTDYHTLLKFMVKFMVKFIVADFIHYYKNTAMELEMLNLVNIRLIRFGFNSQAILGDFKFIMVINCLIASLSHLIYIIFKYYFNKSNLIKLIGHFDKHLFKLLLISNTCEQYEVVSYGVCLQLQIMMDNNIIRPFINLL